MIDSHCHLADETFESDLDATIARAREAGVTAALCILAVGDEAEARRARVVQSRWDAIQFATGVHPHAAGTFAGRIAESADVTCTHARAFNVCAIGEIGLDYHYDFAPRDVQREVFAAQIELAKTLALPDHHPYARGDRRHVRDSEENTPGVRGVFHCFTGDAAMARRALDIGFHLSFAGIVTFPKAGDLRDAARIVPARPAADRDRQPVPGAGAASRQAQRTGLRGARAGIAGGGPRRPGRGAGRGGQRQFWSLVRAKSRLTNGLAR